MHRREGARPLALDHIPDIRGVSGVSSERFFQVRNPQSRPDRQGKGVDELIRLGTQQVCTQNAMASFLHQGLESGALSASPAGDRTWKSDRSRQNHVQNRRQDHASDRNIGGGRADKNESKERN